MLLPPGGHSRLGGRVGSSTSVPRPSCCPYCARNESRKGQCVLSFAIRSHTHTQGKGGQALFRGRGHQLAECILSKGALQRCSVLCSIRHEYCIVAGYASSALQWQLASLYWRSSTYSFSIYLPLLFSFLIMIPQLTHRRSNGEYTKIRGSPTQGQMGIRPTVIWGFCGHTELKSTPFCREREFISRHLYQI